MTKLNILGNRRETRYDDNLADRINKEIEEQERRQPKKSAAPKQSPIAKPKEQYFNLGELIIGNEPADNGEEKTPNQWIDYWNNINDGRRFASVPDYLQATKQLKNADQDKVKTLLDSLRSDFNSWLSLNTRINYNTSNLNAKIIQNYKCKDASLIKETNCKVPILSGIYLNDVKNDKEVQQYMEALSGISDINETASLLQYISNKSSKEIKLWTPNQDSRKEYPERAVFFDYNGGGFHVNGGSHVVNYGGRSRGVRPQNFP